MRYFFSFKLVFVVLAMACLVGCPTEAQTQRKKRANDLWERVPYNRDGYVGRTPVPGGWIIISDYREISTMFYPDPEHKWDIVNPENNKFKPANPPPTAVERSGDK